MALKPKDRFDRLLHAMPTRPNSPQETIEHQIRRLAQVMAKLELATQTQPFSL